MKALTATCGGGGNILCSHRSGNNHQFISFKQLSPLSIHRSFTNQDHLFGRPKSCLKFKLVTARAADSPALVHAAGAGGGKSIVEDDEFSLAKVSFGIIGLGRGLSLLSYGFGAYFNILPGSEWSALMLTYGFPLSIIGMALKVRDDVIRYRYGDEQHLDEALKRIFQYGLGSGVARRNAPVFKKIREEVTEDGKYCLVLVFKAKALELADFEKRQQKFATFFGPGISAEVGIGEEQNMYDGRLISKTTL